MIHADWLARFKGRCPVCAAIELAGEGATAAETAAAVYGYATADALEVAHALASTTSTTARAAPTDFLRSRQDACARHWAALNQSIHHARGGLSRA